MTAIKPRFSGANPNYMAPEGKIWVCLACGKKAKNALDGARNGWDASCAINCVLIDEATETVEFSENQPQNHPAS